MGFSNEKKNMSCQNAQCRMEILNMCSNMKEYEWFGLLTGNRPEAMMVRKRWGIRMALHDISTIVWVYINTMSYILLIRPCPNGLVPCLVQTQQHAANDGHDRSCVPRNEGVEMLLGMQHIIAYYLNTGPLTQYCGVYANHACIDMCLTCLACMYVVGRSAGG